jgi:hypothetical protein
MELVQHFAWSKLPNELKIQIIRDFFDIPELAQLRLINKDFKQLSDHDQVR